MASDSEPRKNFLMPLEAIEVTFVEQKASASVLRMICYNHGLMGDFMGPFTYALSNQMFHRAARSFRGPVPLPLP